MEKDTNFILIKHGEPNYSKISEKWFINHNHALAPLTKLGVEQAKDISTNDILKNCDVLITSPCTRTIQTASIISNKINLPLIVELNLHEWMKENYETLKHVRNRTLYVLEKYLEYEKVCVITHEAIISSITGKKYDFCNTENITLSKQKIKCLYR